MGGRTLTAAWYRESGIIEPANPDAPLILYWDGYGRLQVVEWTVSNSGQLNTDNFAHFLFGSVVGLTVTAADDEWGTGDIVYNPTSTLNSVWEASGSGYNSIPCWGNWTPVAPATKPSSYGVNNPDTVDFISSAAYHNYENVKAGRGDPCKLVGYTADEVKTWTKETFPTTSKYRLPTNPENHEFVGYSGITPDGRDVNGDGSYFDYVDGTPYYGVFKRSSPANKVLPILGQRDWGGEPIHWNEDSHWWSSTPTNANDGYDLYFGINKNLRLSYSNHSRLGIGVRCIPVD